MIGRKDEVRAVLLRYQSGEEEWLCATRVGDKWSVPDTQCGGHYEIDVEDEQVLKTVQVLTDA